MAAGRQIRTRSSQSGKVGAGITTKPRSYAKAVQEVTGIAACSGVTIESKVAERASDFGRILRGLEPIAKIVLDRGESCGVLHAVDE